MPQTSLNKSSLKKERDQLDLYRQYLPSLDLKRQQFLGLVKTAEKQLRQIETAAAQKVKEADPWLPFLANQQIELKGLVQVDDLQIQRENQLGLTLPYLRDLSFKPREYSFFHKPLWVDGLVQLLQEVCRLALERELAANRLALLRKELQTLTQRVNLFDKVLIPSAKDKIRKIGIALSDMETAGVVRAKIAKKKRQQRSI